MLLALALAATLLASAHGVRAPLEPGAATDGDAGSSYGKLPVSFVPNRGQVDRDARYYAQGSGFSFAFTDHGAVLAFDKGKRGHALELSFLGANPRPALDAQRRMARPVNYLTGSHHRTGIPTYGQLTYRDLWPGIDMVFKGRGGRLVYEFHVAAGADPGQIRLSWKGADGLSLSETGVLSIETPLGSLTDARPRSYQRTGSRRVAVPSAFALDRGAATSYGFSLGRYDRTKALVIDPSLAYSTYLGGTGREFSEGIAVDGQGSVYVSGTAYSSDFPTTAGAYDTTFASTADAFVTKLEPDGSGLVYSTYLGGSSGADAHGIGIDSAGHAYVTGVTSSDDFPTTPAAYDRTLTGSSDLFVTELSADGTSAVYSTYLGGAQDREGVRDIAVDDSGAAYVSGATSSSDFPTTLGAYDTTLNGASDLFVSKLSPGGSNLAYSTLVGGSSYDFNRGIAVDAAGSAYVAGGTESSDFPTTLGAYDRQFNAFDTTYLGGDAYVTKLSPNGSSLAYSTFVGGSRGGEQAIDIALDGQGHAFITGQTRSDDFPVTPGSYDYSGVNELFVTKVNGDGSGLAYSRFFGSPDYLDDAYGGIAVDAGGSAYVTGSTSGAIPTTSGAHDNQRNGGDDAWLAKFGPDGKVLEYGSYLGGSGFDEPAAVAVDEEAAYVVGRTGSTDFPTTENAFDSTFAGDLAFPSFYTDLFISKLYTSGPEVLTSRVVVKKKARPASPQDFSFSAGGGLTPASFALDDDPSDSTLSDRKFLAPVAPGNGYSVSENTPPRWELWSTSCDDGSPVSSIDLQAGETVTCTFVNDQLGYARPQYAGVASIPLVPAFFPCFSDQVTGYHNPPRSVPSCPMRELSQYLTFNAPDRSAPFDSPATGKGSIHLKLFCTDGTTPPCTTNAGDQQDVRISTAISGVRCQGASGGCSAAGSPYDGQVMGILTLRITDRLNGPSGTSAGTTGDVPFGWGLQCSGGACSSTTSADAVIPGLIREGKRAIWDVSTVEINDAGSDGELVAAPSPGSGACPPACAQNDFYFAPFLRQGLFVP